VAIAGGMVHDEEFGHIGIMIREDGVSSQTDYTETYKN
jgi:hypothetical protein